MGLQMTCCQIPSEEGFVVLDTTNQNTVVDVEHGERTTRVHPDVGDVSVSTSIRWSDTSREHTTHSGPTCGTEDDSVSIQWSDTSGETLGDAAQVKLGGGTAAAMEKLSTVSSASTTTRDSTQHLERTTKPSCESISCESISWSTATKVSSSAEVLELVDTLISTTGDVLAADTLLRELHEVLRDDQEWDMVLSSPIFGRFVRKMNNFQRVGQACAKSRPWFNVYTDKKTGSTIEASFDAKDDRILHYRVSAHIPTSLTNVLAIANEVQLMPTWNSFVDGQPAVLGQRSAHHMILNYKISMLRGLYKLDVLNEVQRFSDPEGGFLVEYIESVGKGHSCYRDAAPGYKRPEVKLQNMWVACGPHNTCLLQVGEVRLPFSLSKWIVSNLGSLGGSSILGGLVKNSMQASQPGNPWEELIRQDALGLYGRLDTCVQSKESLKRGRASKSHMSEFCMEPFFQGRDPEGLKISGSKTPTQYAAGVTFA